MTTDPQFWCEIWWEVAETEVSEKGHMPCIRGSYSEDSVSYRFPGKIWGRSSQIIFLKRIQKSRAFVSCPNL
jgi:hypothetical protein